LFEKGSIGAMGTNRRKERVGGKKGRRSGMLLETEITFRGRNPSADEKRWEKKTKKVGKEPYEEKET